MKLQGTRLEVNLRSLTHNYHYLKIAADLTSLAHRILQLKNKDDVTELQSIAKELYEKLTVLAFTEKHFADASPTAGSKEIEDRLGKAYTEAQENVVKGFVNMIMMPIVGYYSGGVDFKDMKIILSEAIVGEDGVITKPESAILYGEWINTIISLILIGFVLFMIVRAYNKFRKKKEEKKAAPAGPTKEEQLLMEIRDAIKSQN